MKADIYIIYLRCAKNEPCKCFQVGDEFIVFHSSEVDLVVFTAVDPVKCYEDVFEEPSTLASCSRISDVNVLGDDPESQIWFTFLNKDVVDMYNKAANKSRKDLAVIFLDDHNWHLKSYDHNQRGIVKLYCAEC
jgi:hypothetical protein